MPQQIFSEVSICCILYIHTRIRWGNSLIVILKLLRQDFVDEPASPSRVWISLLVIEGVDLGVEVEQLPQQLLVEGGVVLSQTEQEDPQGHTTQEAVPVSSPLCQL